MVFFFFQAEDGIRDIGVTGVQTCALPISPIERPITEQRVWSLTEDSMITMGYKSQRFNEEPYNAFSVLRARFDKWFADKAVEAGAVLITETVAEDVLRENGQIVGVRTNREDGDLRANVVIAADGVNSLRSEERR